MVGGTINSPDSTEKTEVVQQEETEKKEEKKEEGDAKKDNKKAIKKNDKIAKTMDITSQMVEYYIDKGSMLYSFERSVDAPGKNVEYEEIQSVDSDEPVYLWAENKNGQCRVKYYSEAYSIEMSLTPSFQALKYDYLTILELPEGVTEIPDKMFSGFGNLAKIVLPESLKKIGIDAFEGCDCLKKIEIPSGVEEIGRGAFSESALESITLPPRLKCVESGTFNNCENLTSVTLNKGLEEIGERAFSHTGITELVMPSTLKKIGKQAFDCSDLTSLTLNEGLESIERMAFYGCHIKAFSLPSTLKTLGDAAFDDKLIGGQLPEGLETISGRLNESVKVNNNFVMDENGVIFNKDKTALLATTKDLQGEYRIPDGVVSIGCEAFKGQTISGITWNQELETIGTRAFQGCNNLTSVPPVPAGVKELHDTFWYCKNLEKVVVPGTVEKLSYTFRGCKNLTSVTLEEGIEEINRIFEDCEKLQNVVYPNSAVVK